MLLAIDTATQWCSIALHDGQEVIAERTWRSVNHHTTELAPAVFDMLAHENKDVADLTALAVAAGPGSYTGLRIGVAFAKGLALGQKLPLVGVTTLDILAAAHPPVQATLAAVVEAGRSRVVMCAYRWRRARWAARAEAALLTWEALIDQIESPTVITGEVDEAGRAALAAAQARSVPVTLSAPAVRLRRAGYLADEAWVRLREQLHDGFPAGALTPVYVKTKDSPV
jgi:tRNA threonylcarbamoyladenosine biosynthesis protein TsaB